MSFSQGNSSKSGTYRVSLLGRTISPYLVLCQLCVPEASALAILTDMFIHSLPTTATFCFCWKWFVFPFFPFPPFSFFYSTYLLQMGCSLPHQSHEIVNTVPSFSPLIGSAVVYRICLKWHTSSDTTTYLNWLVTHLYSRMLASKHYMKHVW